MLILVKLLGSSALEWLRVLQLQNVDFEVDSKSVTDNVYGRRIMNSDFRAIINECCTLLVYDLVTFEFVIRFIRNQ